MLFTRTESHTKGVSIKTTSLNPKKITYKLTRENNFSKKKE
jgi:hypothetical protein